MLSLKIGRGKGFPLGFLPYSLLAKVKFPRLLQHLTLANNHLFRSSLPCIFPLSPFYWSLDCPDRGSICWLHHLKPSPADLLLVCEGLSISSPPTKTFLTREFGITHLFYLPKLPIFSLGKWVRTSLTRLPIKRMMPNPWDLRFIKTPFHFPQSTGL